MAHSICRSQQANRRSYHVPLTLLSLADALIDVLMFLDKMVKSIWPVEVLDVEKPGIHRHTAVKAFAWASNIFVVAFLGVTHPSASWQRDSM
jgi:hypothetical protein